MFVLVPDTLIWSYVCLSAPGGSLSDEVTSTEFCLFKAQEDMETMQAYAQASVPKIAAQQQTITECNW